MRIMAGKFTVVVMACGLCSVLAALCCCFCVAIAGGVRRGEDEGE